MHSKEANEDGEEMRMCVHELKVQQDKGVIRSGCDRDNAGAKSLPILLLSMSHTPHEPRTVSSTSCVLFVSFSYSSCQIGEDGVRLATTLNNNRNSEFCAPLTSFDWNDSDPRRLGTSRCVRLSSGWLV